MARHSLKSNSRRLAAGGAVAAAGCAVCLGMSTSVASAAILPPSVLSLIGSGIVTDDTRTGTGTDYYPDSPQGTIEVVTPGTDDTGLRPRIDKYVADRTTLLINYPQSFGPIIAGQSGKFPLFAPGYDKSKEMAIEGNLVVMEELSNDPNVVFVRYSGYSQGADALGNALERAVAAGIIDKSKTVVVLTSDPRSPWGLKQGLDKLPLVPTLAGLIGADIDGARDPADTEDVQVEAIIVTADPVGNWQWKTLRPLSSLAVNAAGFFGCHSDPACYGDLLQYGAPAEYKSVDGNTTYKVYRSLHPFTLLRMNVYKDLGLEYTAEDVSRWEKAAQAFYAIEEPSADNSAVPVYAVTTPMTSTSGSTEPVIQTGEEVPANPMPIEAASTSVPKSETPTEDSADSDQSEAPSSEVPPASVSPVEETSSEEPIEETSVDEPIDNELSASDSEVEGSDASVSDSSTPSDFDSSDDTDSSDSDSSDSSSDE
jgi:hypothetical protein